MNLKIKIKGIVEGDMKVIKRRFKEGRSSLG